MQHFNIIHPLQESWVRSMYFSYCLTICTSIFVVVFLIRLHVLISHHVITKAHVRSQASPCGIYGAQSATGTEFSPSTLVFPCHYNDSNALALLNKTVPSLSVVYINIITL
jgi:hypothetical protein